MKEKLIHRLKSLYQNAKKEFLERPIATIKVLVSSIVVILPLVLSESWRGFVLSLLSKAMKPQIELSLIPLLISLMLLIVLAFFLLRPKKMKLEDFLFIPFDSFTWKVTLPGNRQFSVDSIPYCKNHQIKLLPTGRDNDFFVCPVCGSKAGTKLPLKRRQILFQAVTNLAEAKLENHIKKDCQQGVPVDAGKPRPT